MKGSLDAGFLSNLLIYSISDGVRSVTIVSQSVSQQIVLFSVFSSPFSTLNHIFTPQKIIIFIHCPHYMITKYSYSQSLSIPAIVCSTFRAYAVQQYSIVKRLSEST